MTDAPVLSAAELVVLNKDLSVLTPPQRLEYYARVCESLGLNPLTQPFDYLVLNGKLTLYAKKDATDQLRVIRGISIDKLERETVGDTYDVTAYGHDKTGRTDASLGSVPIANLRGEALSNAKMKAETKAKRRLTLSLAGLGWLDEVEVPAIAGAEVVKVSDSGEIEEGPSAPPALSEIVAQRLSGPTLVSRGEPEEPEAAPGPAEDQSRSLDLTEAAREIFADVQAEPGIDFATFKRELKARFIPAAQAISTADRLYGPDHPMIKDMTGAQREEILASLVGPLEPVP